MRFINSLTPADMKESTDTPMSLMKLKSSYVMRKTQLKL